MPIPRATVYSVYFDNISPSVVEMQRACVDRFLPDGWTFLQHLWVPGQEPYAHAAALSACVANNANDLTVILDTDCIPVHELAFPMLATSAANGILTGAIQRASHIDNGYHLYVGPFCMAFSKKKYLELGSPTFDATERGDIGEELTYCWQNAGESVAFLWPSQVEQPRWNLYGAAQFGIGTTYDNLFYHHFCIRDGQTQKDFVERCKMFLDRFSEKAVVA